MTILSVSVQAIPLPWFQRLFNPTPVRWSYTLTHVGTGPALNSVHLGLDGMSFRVSSVGVGTFTLENLHNTTTVYDLQYFVAMFS